jgi:predicted alpha/beta-fold hydrolase
MTLSSSINLKLIILSYRGIPYDEISRNDKAILLVTKIGGHLSWFEGIFHPNRWYWKPVLEYLNAMMDIQLS